VRKFSRRGVHPASCAASNELHGMSFKIPGVLWRRDPQAAEVPLIFDSPAQRDELP